uniref:nitrogenase component 1 n=1 Tax=Enterocloster hominis (ex Hitch et al. 2024) TaxID=1917870 RepID=UPI00102FC152|nr:nitrogenase component 1 [Lachnoclostridium pacaense]
MGVLLLKRTNRILPVYAADISGVCSALYELGGMTVMHDASGCNSTYTTHDEPRWYSMDSMVYISALSELEAVMGDDDKLVRDIVDAARNLHPRFICLGGTPIPMMMGTDFKGLARMIEKETGIPTFGIATNGMHSYVQGAGEALRRIAERFCPPADELGKMAAEKGLTGKRNWENPGFGSIRLRVNILGATPLDFSLTGNVSGIRKFLSRHGMETVGCWAMESSLDDMCLAGLADVNLVVSAVGLPAAMELERKYGTPYVIGAPIGRRTALRLASLLRLGAVTGKNQTLFGGEPAVGEPAVGEPAVGEPADVEAAVVEAVDEKAADREDADSKTVLFHANPGIPGLPDNLSRERVLIVGEQVIADSLRCSLREDLGAQDVTVLCPTKGSGCMAEEGDMLVWDEDEAISRIGRSTVVIADPLYRQVCPGDGQRVFVDFPHEACSGRMYHSAMRPFICGS